MNEISPVFVVLGGFVLVGLFWLIATFNRFQALKNHIRESWANIDVNLKRRYDLIPNLVETVKGYAAHEKDVLQMVVEAREKACHSSGAVDQQARDENELVHALNGLFARVEAYPDLKASQHFLELQRELANTEDRIAAARRFYNANIRSYNTLLESFPAGAIGRSAGHQPESYFEVEEVAIRENPKVSV